MGGHSSCSGPFSSGVNSSSNPLAPLNSTVVHSQNTAQQLVYYRPQALSSSFSNCHDVQIFMSHKSTGFGKAEEALTLLALHSNRAKFLNFDALF